MHPLTNETPVVSAVIPTHKRSDVVLRAVHSALSQTYPKMEVVVVIDGPDADTSQILEQQSDPRLRIVQLESNVGGADARNAGVAAARGEWIAFLDDDDEWKPEKIERQVQKLHTANCREPIVSCRFIAHTKSGRYVWPTRFPQLAEPISEYLLVRRGLGKNDGFVATPTILTRRSFLKQVPFRSGLKKHQDWDWVLRAKSISGVELVFCEEPLAICNMVSVESTSRQPDWKFSLSWIHANRDLTTPRAYASFIATHIGWQAAAQRSWRAFFPLLWDAFRRGSLRPIDVLRYIGFWLVPDGLRAVLKKSWRSFQPGGNHTGVPVPAASHSK
jgi:glycosyltransferase involved in cell wall biosynthesis